MKAGIFLVGTELLNGATIDTNSIYIAEELNTITFKKNFLKYVSIKNIGIPPNVPNVPGINGISPKPKQVPKFLMSL